MQTDTYEVRVRWTHAIESYRRSIDMYRKVLELQARRATRVPPTVLVPPNGRTTVEAPPPATPPPFEALTAREREVCHLIAGGYTNAQIAEKLVVTRGTVANHVAHILSKLGLQNRTQLAAYYVAHAHSENSRAPSAG
jgi:DNA-binding NarL/FixJ family response regulator